MDAMGVGDRVLWKKRNPEFSWRWVGHSGRALLKRWHLNWHLNEEWKLASQRVNEKALLAEGPHCFQSSYRESPFHTWGFMLIHSVWIDKRTATRVEVVGMVCSLQVFATCPVLRDSYVVPSKNHRFSLASSFYKWGDDLGCFKGFVTGFFISNGRFETQIQNWLCELLFVQHYASCLRVPVW